jgi:hypothetical protein
MSAIGAVLGTGEEKAMKARRGANVLRLAGVLAAVVLAVAIGGDRGGFAASAANSGADPFDVLDLQVKPFVMIVFDTSGSMKYAPVIPPGENRYPIGGDDPGSRMWQAKRALRDVSDEFKSKLNMGLFTFSPLTSSKHLNSGNNTFDGANPNRINGPLIYVSNSPGAHLFYWDPNNNGRLDDPADLYSCGGTSYAGYFCGLSDTKSGWDDSSSATDVFQSFGNRGYFAIPYPWVSKDPAGGPGGLNPKPATWKTTSPETDYSIVGYKGGANPNGWLPGADGAMTPEASPSNAYNNAYRVPNCDPMKGECRYYLTSRVYRTGKKFNWDLTATASGSKLVSTENFDCSTVTPAVGLTDDTITGTRPCIVMADAAAPTDTTRWAVFFYTSGIWENASGGGCESPVKLVDVPPCDPSTGGATAAASIKNYMALELPMSGTDPANMLTSAVGTANQSIAPNLMGLYVNGFGEGIRTDGGTPILNAMQYLNANSVFPVAPTGLPPGVTQKRYLLIITDGEDGCTGYTKGSNAAAQVLAQTATALYHNTNNRRQAELFLVVFTNDASALVSNYYAQAGSGATSPSAFTNASETLGCESGASCRNAFRATSLDELKQALRDAFSSIANTGEYASARGTVVDDVYEFAATAGTPYTANDPQQRYATSLPVTLQSNIWMPGFRGLLRAYRTTTSGTSVLAWEAGAKLNARVSGTMGAVNCPGIPAATTPVCPGEYTFQQLYGSSSTPPKYTPSTSALIRRRIFTTAGNGVNPAIVPLWPPDTGSTGVAPSDTVTYPPGSLDGSAVDNVGLGIGGMTFADLQTEFEACTGGDPSRIPADCADPTKQLALAMKEAREMILAYTAGADVSRDTSADGAAMIRRNTSGEILYQARSWVLADSTVATPALVGPPVTAQPANHAAEYRFYTDGFRDVDNKLIGTGQVDAGFGLTNPDLDDPSALTDPEKKPVMTVAYLGTNHMLHAFRAGPQSCATAASCPPAGSEGGGEELWAYVPFDQLHKLKDRRKGQTRTNPVFVMASSMRFGDVFVSGNYTAPDGRIYPGKWRTIMYAGRGPGGKYISAIDVTGTGPFTRNSLDTNLPTILWNRGNPDTTDGRVGGTPDSTTISPSPIDLGVTDVGAYAKMGETWSVGALVPVDPTTAFGREWVYWVGSGFSDNAAEGHTIYTLDAVTGDALYAADVGAASGATRPNAIYANVTGYVPNRVYCGTTKDYFAVAGPASAAFAGDVHGRLWKVDVSDLNTPRLVWDFGVNQPIGQAVVVENISVAGVLTPFIYGVTGNDNRVAPAPAATPPFKLFAIADNGGTTGYTLAFSQDYPERMRGSVQPLLFEVCPTNGGAPTRQDVFFGGTQFVPADSGVTCASTFDSVFFALNASTGIAAYNLNATGPQEYAIWRNQKIINITGEGDKVALDKGINASGAPPPPAPPAPRTPFAVPAVNVEGMRFGSPVCN